ncbi:tetratricopeptide (TPR) repeat protein [Streptomyces umbrinus]|uniref:Tetratricopeptide (TPR) repeat protein n=1 Tax=Streptomyces umbrinus TaxID=67370 RepID=A0ABU0SUD9_9ACTN|nr:tetratricopeptide repeat protein [Streptomyces umbrinus]MDQ1027096.1 tetratricopeptide (TPR) repeat protein [Streptomyces umbrinus]
MAQAGPSRQELIQQGNRAGFVGRDTERAVFLRNFDLRPGDPGQRFRFHVHGTAGVGKTFLVQELQHLARERGALTAYVDEHAGSVPEALSEICEQFAYQGRRLKDLERRLTAYRQRRHEAEAAALAALAGGPAPEPETASAGSRAAVGLGLAAVEATLPGGSLLTSAFQADRLALGADHLRAGLGARFRNPDDIELVTSPEKVLTPILLRELRAAAAASSSASEWIVLFFDTYERTGLYLDPWLHEMITRGTVDGGLPATVVVVTAGQRPLDPARWRGLDPVEDVPLAPFTETESRRLLAGKGVVAEPVVEEVLRLTGGLPVLVSTLANKRPGDADAVSDPSADAVELFLRSEPDVRRKVAGICALPRWLDADVFRVLVVDRPDDELDALYEWLTGLPFVGERGERVQYHDVVRAPMLRRERRRSPREWAGRHRRLAEAFARWGNDVGAGREPEDLWEDEEWRGLRLEETYHLLCARPPTALGEALRSLVLTCREDAVAGRRWARMLAEAGDATDNAALREWGRELGEALADDETGVAGAMALLLARPGLDTGGRAAAHTLRGRELRHGGEYGRALEEYARALELDPELAWAHYGRGFTHRLMNDLPAALAAFDRADELAPDTGWIISERAETYRLSARFEEAVADFDRAVALDPTNDEALTGRAVCRQVLGRYDEALADFDRALSIDGEYVWALVRRARLRRDRGEPDEAFADFDRAVALAPDEAWVASERGDAYRHVDRYEEAVTELGRAVSLEPDYASALASRGQALHELGRYEEALADLDRAVELEPDYSWALVMRSRTKDELGDRAGMFEDLRRAVDTDPDVDWISHELGVEYRNAGRHEEAVTVFHRILERSPDDHVTLAGLGGTYRVMKDYPEALRHLDRALELNPDHGWACASRARVGLATGRTERALADLDRCVELGTEENWARREAVELLMLCDRWDEVRARLADADRAPTPDDDLDDLRVEAHRHAGRWTEARQLAERMREAEPVPGVFQLAVTVSRSEGLPAAEALWLELARMIEEGGGLDEPERAQGRCFVACALADWPAADRGLTDFLAMTPGWNDLANLAAILTDVLESPGSDRDRLTALLAEVTTARDEIRTRHAQ